MKNLKLHLRSSLSAIRMFAIESFMGEVTFDEQMDCYWEGHDAAMQTPSPRNPYLHPVRRDAFAAGVRMEESAVTAENPDFPAYGKDRADEVSVGTHSNPESESRWATA